MSAACIAFSLVYVKSQILEDSTGQTTLMCMCMCVCQSLTHSIPIRMIDYEDVVVVAAVPEETPKARD